MDAIPQFEHTPLEGIPELARDARRTFLSHKTRPIEYRLVQLRKLYWGLKDNEGILAEALKKDIGKPPYETQLMEVGMCENDILYACKNLDKWTKDQKPEDVPLIHMSFRPRIRKDPLGCVLIIGTYNFPIQLCIMPLIGAIAAGCTAVLKPSESAPHTAACMEHIIKTYLDQDAYKIVQGAVAEASSLLDQKWDKIFYTGGDKVGRIVAKRAAETLTPYVLELGGINPAIVTRHADPHLAARRLLWAKLVNAGQVCVSQNYVLVDREILPLFVAELERALKEFHPDGVRKSKDYGRIIDARQFQRLKHMLDETRGRILLGGTMDEEDLFFEPTVVQVEDVKDSLIVEESFGPLIPLLPIDGLDEAIRLANEIHDTPLGVYAFGSKAETTRILNETRSGGISINDAFAHVSVPTLPFGGVGASGQGAYHGRESFEAFTHRRAVASTPSWVEKLIAVRYPPYAGKLKQVELLSGKPNFDRDGRVRLGVLGWVKHVLLSRNLLFTVLGE
ncbi:Aldehyde/histidinol dehydrogenase [Lineolata rhizophorae]|uniref:Aldehyde dehydrogenase n=1 Tax=Lineolata rhizophorae TaxID=578093 RepID=A0A6A6P3M8_9PEZI|nr:Aldehyde/histidinol dehydrogenase [Lineolata rhizophorae]